VNGLLLAAIPFGTSQARVRGVRGRSFARGGAAIKAGQSFGYVADERSTPEPGEHRERGPVPSKIRAVPEHDF
jgi:hypothetical protein